MTMVLAHRRHHPLRQHSDDRRTGYFGLFPPDVLEINVARINRGATAGDWHAHSNQDDYWFVPHGCLMVGLRTDDGHEERILLRAGDPTLVIPAGIWHTYYATRSEGPERHPILIYGLTNRYNPEHPDEHRMDYEPGSVWDGWKATGP